MGKRKRRPESLGEIMLDVVPFDAGPLNLEISPCFHIESWWPVQLEVLLDALWLSTQSLPSLRCTQTELHGIKPQHNNINMNDLLVHTLLVGVAGYYVLLSSLVYMWTTCYNHRVQDLSMDFLTLAIPCSLLKPRSEKSSWFKIRFLENWIVKITKTKGLQWYHYWGQHHIEARLNWK